MIPTTGNSDPFAQVNCLQPSTIHARLASLRRDTAILVSVHTAEVFAIHPLTISQLFDWVHALAACPESLCWDSLDYFSPSGVSEHTQQHSVLAISHQSNLHGCESSVWAPSPALTATCNVSSRERISKELKRKAHISNSASRVQWCAGALDDLLISLSASASERRYYEK